MRIQCHLQMLHLVLAEDNKIMTGHDLDMNKTP